MMNYLTLQRPGRGCAWLRPRRSQTPWLWLATISSALPVATARSTRSTHLHARAEASACMYRISPYPTHTLPIPYPTLLILLPKAQPPTGLRKHARPAACPAPGWRSQAHVP